MHFILIPDSGGYLAIQEDKCIGDAIPGRVRMTPEGFFLMISAAKEGHLDQLFAITDGMIERAIAALPNPDSDDLSGGVRYMLEKALNIPQHLSATNTGESDGPGEEEAVVSRS